MANDETLAWVGLLVGALGTIFMGISALKVASARLVTAKAQVTGFTEPVVCPNCGQRFDASLAQGFSPGKYLRLYNGLVTCPRCTFTFEA